MFNVEEIEVSRYREPLLGHFYSHSIIKMEVKKRFKCQEGGGGIKKFIMSKVFTITI